MATEKSYKSKYAKHTLNFDGVPKIEFTPVSKNPDEGGEFSTSNAKQISALEGCEAFRKGIIKEVTEVTS